MKRSPCEQGMRAPPPRRQSLMDLLTMTGEASLKSLSSVFFREVSQEPDAVLSRSTFQSRYDSVVSLTLSQYSHSSSDEEGEENKDKKESQGEERSVGSIWERKRLENIQRS